MPTASATRCWLRPARHWRGRRIEHIADQRAPISPNRYRMIMIPSLTICQTIPLMFTNRVRINTLARGARLPTFAGSREFAEASGLISYGPNFSDLFRRAGELVDKILRGAKPADLPVEQPTKFDLVLNLTAIKAHGLAISPLMLARADEVIE